MNCLWEGANLTNAAKTRDDGLEPVNDGLEPATGSSERFNYSADHSDDGLEPSNDSWGRVKDNVECNDVGVDPINDGTLVANEGPPRAQSQPDHVNEIVRVTRIKTGRVGRHSDA
jgi:hypothetical protein